jgi:RimJ/RimL family protein N-acetyltransferase
MEITIEKLKYNQVDLIVEYWYSLSDSELLKFGADKTRFLKPKEWLQKLKDEISKPVEQNQFYYFLWHLDGIPVGHSNIDQIKYGDSAFMHLHLWKSKLRQKSLGFQFLQKTIPLYFKTFQLEKLFCEPNSENVAPNRVLEKLDFNFVGQFEKKPNWITFHQKVNQYVLNSKDFFKEI